MVRHRHSRRRLSELTRRVKISTRSHSSRPKAQPRALLRWAGGKPMVVNLWASWFPPCRREMPVLAAAQQRRTDVSFVIANQGENVFTLQQYLEAGKLELRNVVLDPQKGLGRKYGLMALPTTLFYDITGRLVDTHLGALSAASLASKLERLQGARAVEAKVVSQSSTGQSGAALWVP